MPIILQSAIGSILRWALMLGVAFLVKRGIWTSSEAGGYVEAGVVALLALGWALWNQYKSRVKFLTALMPGPKTEDDVVAHIASGATTPSILTPPNTVPGVPLPAAATATPPTETKPGQ
jgi:hypothetical protein